jgi:hypothetical protein
MPSLRVSFPAHRVVIQLTRNLVPFTFYHLNPAFQFSLTSTICNPDDIAKTIHGRSHQNLQPVACHIHVPGGPLLTKTLEVG